MILIFLGMMSPLFKSMSYNFAFWLYLIFFKIKFANFISTEYNLIAYKRSKVFPCKRLKNLWFIISRYLFVI